LRVTSGPPACMVGGRSEPPLKERKATGAALARSRPFAALSQRFPAMRADAPSRPQWPAQRFYVTSPLTRRSRRTSGDHVGPSATRSGCAHRRSRGCSPAPRPPHSGSAPSARTQKVCVPSTRVLISTPSLIPHPGVRQDAHSSPQIGGGLHVRKGLRIIAGSRWTFIRGLVRETSQSAVLPCRTVLTLPRWRNRFLLAPSTERE
jgi:hypothetical protein